MLCSQLLASPCLMGTKMSSHTSEPFFNADIIVFHQNVGTFQYCTLTCPDMHSLWINCANICTVLLLFIRLLQNRSFTILKGQLIMGYCILKGIFISKFIWFWLGKESIWQELNYWVWCFSQSFLSVVVSQEVDGCIPNKHRGWVPSHVINYCIIVLYLYAPLVFVHSSSSSTYFMMW